MPCEHCHAARQSRDLGAIGETHHPQSVSSLVFEIDHAGRRRAPCQHCYRRSSLGCPTSPMLSLASCHQSTDTAHAAMPVLVFRYASTMSPSSQNLQLALSAIPIVISIAALVISIGGHRAARARYVTDLRREWADLSSEWARSLLLFRGPDDYYIDASTSTRGEVAELIRRAEGEQWKTEGTDITAWTNSLRAEARHLHIITRFLAHCSYLVASGRITSHDVYRVLGPDVSSHGAAIRWISGSQRNEPWVGAYQINSSHFYGEQESVLSLVDILWAETVRQGDNEPHSLSGVASHKARSKTGRACRKRLFYLALQSTRNPLHAHRLARSLRIAEFVPYRVLNRDDALWEHIDENCSTYGSIPIIGQRIARHLIKRQKSRFKNSSS